MKYLVVVCAVLAVATAHPFIDKNTHTGGGGRRVRRAEPPKAEVPISQNTKYGLKDGIPYVQHQVNLANSGDHNLNAQATVSKDFHNNGPIVTSGSLNYAHQPSGAGLQISGTNVPHGGTNVGAAGVWNVYRNGGFGVDLKGGYKQNFGGPGGSGSPIWGVEIQGGYAFPRRG